MSDFKFSCSHCGQHIAADPAWSGRQIQCPSCHAPITVPQAVAPPPPLPPIAPKSPPRVSAAPVASAAPAKPAGKSNTGLIIGIIAGVVVLGIAGLAVAGMFAYRFVQKQARQIQNQQQVGSSRRQPAQATPPRTTASGAPNRIKDSPVTTDAATAAIPAEPARGTIRGQPFMIDAAEINSVTFTLKQGTRPFPDASLTFFLFLKPNEKVDGRTFTFSANDKAWPRPHIHVMSKDGDRNFSKTEIVTSNYALRIEFGERQGGKIPGKIYLELGEQFGTKVAGTFEATVK